MTTPTFFSRGEIIHETAIRQRLNQLRAELESGRKTLVELENKETNLRNSVKRISDAIEVLEDKLSKEER